MTDAEAAAIERLRGQAQRRGPGAGRSEPNGAQGGRRHGTDQVVSRRPVPRRAAAASAATTWSGSIPGDRIAVVDGQKRTSLIVDPPNGRVPPMKPEARQRNGRVPGHAREPRRRRRCVRRARRPVRRTREHARSPSGASSGSARPRARPTLPNYFYNNLKQIVQTRDRVLILNEMVHDARIIRIGGTHPPAHMKFWMGDSIGRWDGDTLVVETTNFTDKTQFRGSGEQLKVTERFTRTDANTLLYRFTVEDPTTWDRSWTGEYPWNASTEAIFEYACHEGNHALGGVLRGARVMEAEAAKKKRETGIGDRGLGDRGCTNEENSTPSGCWRSSCSPARWALHSRSLQPSDRARRRPSRPAATMPAARALPTATPESVGISSERLARLHKGMQAYVDRKEVGGIVTLHRTRRQDRGRARLRLPGRREPEGHARRHDLPHRVHDQARHQRRRDDAAGRGPAAPHRSRVEVHPGLQGAARDRRRRRDRAGATRDDGSRSPVPSLRALVRIPERRARWATPTARRASPTA